MTKDEEDWLKLYKAIMGVPEPKIPHKFAVGEPETTYWRKRLGWPLLDKK